MKIKYFSLFLFALISPLAATAADSNLANNPSKATNDAFVTLTVDQFSQPVSKDTINQWITHSTEISLTPNIKSEFENISYCPVNKIYCAITLTNIQKQHLHFSSESSIDTKEIDSYVQDLARKVNSDPQDAKFKIENGAVTTFSPAQNGINLNVSQSVQIISDALKNNSQPNQTISLPFDSKKPSLDYADANDMGISSLIGQGKSDFKGSPTNRIKNIKVAASKFNGLLIKPGEEFTFVKHLGEVDAENGYFPELVIKKNITEPEFGGGICQVSTTAFRAAIYSGLKITARRNHAYPVSYYNPQGMDSTVYIPNPDLKFTNNTPRHILIQTRIVGTQLFFDFYGTDDGRKTTIDGPYITEKQPDGALKATFTQHVVDKDGKEFINDVFNSSYQSPYKFPHAGGPVLTAKPSNWSGDEWKNYQQQLKDIAKASKNKP